MTIKTTIVDGAGKGNSANIIDGGVDYPNGIMTYTRPLGGDTESLGGFFFNPTTGADMNVAAGFSGTPEGIHDGTDSTKWTASALSGTWDFASTDQAQSGTKSIDATAASKNREALLEDGTSISTADYVALTGWIYVTEWLTLNSGVEVRCRLNGVDVGDPVSLQEYFRFEIQNVWVKLVIPIEDFNTVGATIDEIVIKQIGESGSAAPKYYLDNLQWEQEGSPLVYDIFMPKGIKFGLTELNITMAAPFNTTLADASVPNIPFDKLCGQTALTNGIILRTDLGDGTFINQGIIKQHVDLMSFAGVRFYSGGDATNLWVTYNFTFDVPPIFDERLGQRPQFVISEDLSNLSYFKIQFRGTLEQL